MPYNRRNLLTLSGTVAVGLAGCMSTGDNDDGDNVDPNQSNDLRGTGTDEQDDPDDQSSSDDTEEDGEDNESDVDDNNGDDDTTGENDVGPPLEVALTSVDDDLEELSFDVEIVNVIIGEDQLASFNISVENTTDEPVSYAGSSFSDQSFYGFYQRQDGIRLFPADKMEKQPLDEVEGCARFDELWLPDIFASTELDPGERLTNEYLIAGWEGAFNSGSQSCPEPRNYRVESEYGDYGV